MYINNNLIKRYIDGSTAKGLYAIVAIISCIVVYKCVISIPRATFSSKPKKAKGLKREILIVKKRETYYTLTTATTHVQTEVPHYSVDFIYQDFDPTSDKIHTLFCSRTIFDHIKEGEKYTATIKFNDIIALNSKTAFDLLEEDCQDYDDFDNYDDYENY